jgi:hypothetical protein
MRSRERWSRAKRISNRLQVSVVVVDLARRLRVVDSVDRRRKIRWVLRPVVDLVDRLPADLADRLRNKTISVDRLRVDSADRRRIRAASVDRRNNNFSNNHR